MSGFWNGLLTADFLPHGWCYRWDAGVVGLHVASDVLIALSYFLIPPSLLYIVRRRGDFAYPWMFVLFGLFILACGTTHLMSVVTVWRPWYRLDGVIKLITALVSLPTALLLIRMAPAIVAIPGPAQWRQINRQLRQEIEERKHAEAEVRRLNEDLEQRVLDRTAELEKLNQRLRQSEQQLAAIVDSSPAMVTMRDTGGRFRLVNRPFEQAFGVSQEQAVGRTAFDLFPRTTAESWATADTEVLRAGAAREYEEIAFHGGIAHVYVSVKFPLFDDAGTAYAVCGIATDITERKRTEVALRQSNQELEQFAWIAAHDLREPLRNIRNYCQLLERRYKSQMDADAMTFLGFIVGGVDQMHDMVNGLQTWSEARRNAGAPGEMIHSAEVLAETLRNMQTTLTESGSEVTIDQLQPVRMNRAQLGQVFQNLIGNAIKYRAPERPPRIHVRGIRRTHEYEIIVQDNGIGIDMRYAEQIFGVFRRLHGREIPGAGIGLAICQKLVAATGGRIWVESTLGSGSEFHFTIPG